MSVGGTVSILHGGISIIHGAFSALLGAISILFAEMSIPGAISILMIHGAIIDAFVVVFSEFMPELFDIRLSPEDFALGGSHVPCRLTWYFLVMALYR